MAVPGQDKSHESHANYVRIPCIVFFAVTPIFLFIRFYNRISRRTGLGWDDATILVSFVCTLVVQICMMFSCNYGFGKHIFSLPKNDKLLALELFYVAQIFYKLTINLTKTSILLLYLRIFIQRWFRICCYTLMGIILTYMVVSTGLSIWQCQPIRGAWDKSIHPTCINLTKNWYANAGYSIATDVLILLLPMQPIWASQLPINQKRALMLVFAMGSFVTVTSILRATTLDFSTTSPDITYDIASTLWTMIEENVAIICACLPMCRMVLAWIFPSVFGSAGSVAAAGSSGQSHGSAPSYKLGSYQRSSSPNESWQPYSGPTQATTRGRSVAQHNDDTSEEFILHDIPKAHRRDKQWDGSIRKTTEYQVSYERDPYRKP